MGILRLKACVNAFIKSWSAMRLVCFLTMIGIHFFSLSIFLIL